MIQLVFVLEHGILVCKSGFRFFGLNFLVKVNEKWFCELTLTKKVQTKILKALLHTITMRSTRKTS
jgi:hypothetical protein